MTAALTIHAAFAGHIAAALDALEAAGTLPGGLNRAAVAVEPPRDPSHGDLATNAAMVLAKPAGLNPRARAELLVAELTKVPGVASAEIAGPGFINLRVDAAAWIAELRAIAALGGDYGRSTMGQGSTVNVEYVSANPTGPLHVGHARQAALGDAVSSLLATQGHQVTREFYYNDAGVQIATLARSTQLRIRGFKPGDACWPNDPENPESKNFYNGDYIQDIADAFLRKETVKADDRAFTASGDARAQAWWHQHHVLVGLVAAGQAGAGLDL